MMTTTSYVIPRTTGVDWALTSATAAATGVDASVPIEGVNTGAPMTAMSPDALLTYCQMQLGTIDGEIGTQMTSQQLQLRQRSAVEAVQSALEACGSQGPSTAQQMKTCVDAFDKAIGELDKNDPVARQLTEKRDQMTTDYGYSAQSPTPEITETTSEGTFTTPASDGLSLTKPPSGEAWKGTIDSVGNLTNDIRSSAEIGMLKLQDLVSKRQQAVSLVTGIMGKTDQALEDGAKAIGR